MPDDCSSCFCTTDDVVASFEALSDNLPAELDPVLEYFEDSYIGRPDRRGIRRNPLFPIIFWSVYDRVLQQNDRTSNSAEA